MSTPAIQTLGIAGTGAMGRGIAQIAAQAGLEVRLYDAKPGAAETARTALLQTLQELEAKGKVAAGTAVAVAPRLVVADALAGFAGCDAVVEAIVENLEAKRDLFRTLEQIVAPQAILATNTSSLSVTAIAAACTRPERVAGFHFFNPVPLMKVVEVVAGARTAPAACEALTALASRMGHAPVNAKDTPGFIVNHAGRGYLTEALRAVGESAGDFIDVDRILREQVALDGKGFRLGPFELLDLTALDVSHPVMESVYRQYYEEPRYRPSVITAQRLAAGLLGKKVGEGFYRYVDGKPRQPEEAPVPRTGTPPVWISRVHEDGEARVLHFLAAHNIKIDEGIKPHKDSLLIVTPYGEDATTCAVKERLDAARVVAVDTLFPLEKARRRTIMTTPATLPAMRDAAHALFAADGVPVTRLRDTPGFVAQRVVAMIVAIGSDMAQQRIATPEDIDTAVRLGLAYPMGPLAMGDAVGPATVLMILDNLLATTGDPRYRAPLWLKRRALLGLSLKHPE